MTGELIGQDINTETGKLRIIKLLGKGKSGYSYLAEIKNRKVVFKNMHDEECAYYDFGNNNKVELEVAAYHRLKECGLSIPQLITYDLNQNFLVKELIDGPTATELIVTDSLNEKVVKQLFELFKKAKNCGLNIDYFPSNFVTENSQLYYIDYEFNPYMEEWDLINWGIYYWANSQGFKKFLETGNSLYINQSENSGLPIKNPFQEKVNYWIAKYYR